MKTELIKKLIEKRLMFEEADKILKQMKKEIIAIEEDLLNDANEQGISSFKTDDENVIFSSREFISIIGGKSNLKPRIELLNRLYELGYDDKITMIPDILKKDLDIIIKELSTNTRLSFINDKLISFYNKPIITIRQLN